MLIWYCTLSIYCFLAVRSFAVPRSPKSAETALDKHQPEDEPSCDELKRMWRLSKRQSRAAEITNEIPMARDPFADNIWEPPYYASTRSSGMLFQPRPVFGRVVHKVPFHIHDLGERTKAFREVASMYAAPRPKEPRRRFTTFRLSGGGGHLGFPPQQGSFQHLKELIKTERARELQEQRRAEEAAAKQAAMKLLDDNHRNLGAFHDMNYKYDLEDLENDRNTFLPNHNDRGIITFPDMLAPAARPVRIDPGSWSTNPRYIQDYSYSKSRPRSYSFFDDTSSFNTGYNGYLV